MSEMNDKDRKGQEGEEHRQWEGEGFTFTDAPAQQQGDTPAQEGREAPAQENTARQEQARPQDRPGQAPNGPVNPNAGGWSTRPPMGQHPPYGGQQGTGGWTPPGQQPPYGGYGYGGQQGRPQAPLNQMEQQDSYRWNFADYESGDQGAKQPAKKKNKGLSVFVGLLCTVVIIGVISFAGYGIYTAVNRGKGPQGDPGSPSTSMPIGDNPSISVKDRPSEDTESVPSDGKLTPAQIFKKVSPSVVGIANYQGNNTFTASSEGSGIIMTEDGYIVTNAHVVNGAKGLSVTLNNGETYSASIIGADTKTDLAVIKIEANNLTPAEFGNSDQVEVGDYVVAIGNPGGMLLSSSMSRGIVSGLNRNVSDNSYSTPFIQTDAAINPGNSGGALLNEYGQVIGINSAKLVATDYEGIGFSIPTNNAMPIIQDLIRYGRVTGRAELGLTGQMIDDTTSRISGYPVGVGVVGIKRNSDLAVKGVAPGDIITRIDGTPITAFKQITDVVAAKKPGDSVRLTIYRRSTNGGAGRTFEVNVTLIEDDGTSANLE